MDKFWFVAGIICMVLGIITVISSKFEIDEIYRGFSLFTIGFLSLRISYLEEQIKNGME